MSNGFSQQPDSIIIVPTFADFPAGAEVGQIGVAQNSGDIYTFDGSVWNIKGSSTGTGSVTSVSVTSANGVSGTVATATTTPAITLALGAITPSSVAATGAVTGSNLSGTNTGDQTITLTGAVTGSGTGSFATTFGSIGAHTLVANNTSGSAVPTATAIGNLTESTSSVLTITGGTNAVVGNVSIRVGQSTTSTSGYLSSTDWNTFNGKQATLTLGNLTDTGTDGIVITGGTGAVIGSGTTVSQHVADTTHNGYLSSTDWNTFNGKQGAFSGLSTDGVIYATSATAVASTTVGTAFQPLVSNGAGQAPTFQALSLAQAAAITGVLPNANTTATNANTAATIVARDGSGNFSAGTITAALTGAASSNVLKAGDTMTGALTVPSVVLSGTAGAGYLEVPQQSGSPSTPASGYRLFSDSTNNFIWKGANGFTRSIDDQSITANRSYVLPDISGNVVTNNSTDTLINKSFNNVPVVGTGGNGYISLPSQSSAPTTPGTGFTEFADNSNRLAWKDTTGFVRALDGSLTADRVYSFQDVTMTLAGTAATQGGTAQTSYAAGDLLYASATNTLAKLTAGTNRQCLKINGGTGLPQWLDFVDPAFTFRVWEDFLTDSNLGTLRWTTTVNGGNAAIAPDATLVDNNHPGIMNLTTGTTNTGRAAHNWSLNTGLVFGNGVWTYKGLFNIPALSNATDEYFFRVGFVDTVGNGSDDTVDGVYFLYDRTQSVNWIIKTANNSTRTSTTTSTAVATGWHNFLIQSNAAGSLMTFSIDGVAVGTISTNIPTAIGRDTAPGHTITKTAGTTAVSFYVDFVYIECYFTNTR